MAHQTSQVYVIDDDAASRESVMMDVRTLGLEVHPFDSAEAFLHNYDGYRPGCIVVDMGILIMSDQYLLLELRRRGLTIPVIILTDHADTPTTVLAMKNGAFTTLDKPCPNSVLWDAIRDALHEDVKRSQDDTLLQEVRLRLAQLTPQEFDVLRRVLAGVRNKAIAYELDIGLRTVESRRKALFRKIRVDSVAQLIKLVMLAEPELLPQESSERRSDSASEPIPRQP